MRRFSAFLFGLLIFIGGCSPSAFKATDITGADFAKGFELTGHDGNRYTLDSFKGKVVLIFFGFTQCPDVCPSALSRFASVAQELGADADQVQVLFISVDPERDTPELLSQYVPAFNPRFLGLYGNAETTARTAKEFKVIYQKQPGKTDSTYTIDHSAGTYVFDKSGRVRLFLRHEAAVEDVVHDVRLLLKQ
jgi:protein SCO1/2